MKQIDHLLRRMLHLLGLQTSISGCAVYHWGRVHCHVASITWCHSCHELALGNEGARLQGHLYWALCLLQSIWRQLGCSKTCKASKAMPKDHIHVCYHHFCKHVCNGLIKIFPIDTKDRIADALTKALAQNDFQKSLLLHVQCVTSLNHQSEGVLHN